MAFRTDRVRRPERCDGPGRRGRAAAASAVLVVAGLLSGLAVTAPASPAAAAVSPGPFSVNIANREDVRQFFNLVHEATNGVADGWTGSIATCTPGTVSADYLNAALAQTNYFRTMAGEPGVTFTDANNAEAQAAALIQSANRSLDHHPASTSACWTQLGSDGSSHSNLAGGYPGVGAVDSWVYDSGPLGHRRNMLDPSITTVGFGRIPASGGFPDRETQLVLTAPAPARPPVRDGYVVWPPAGFVPYQVISPRWSFSLPGANFTAASVSMTHNGSAVPVQIRCVDPNASNDPGCGQYGEPAISWTANSLPDGANWPKPSSDDPYSVTISGVTVNGAAAGPFTYRVSVIDPAVSDPAHTAAQAPQGPTSPATNSNPTYTINPIADAAGYQWRTTPIATGDLVDGAENGLGSFTASVAPVYTPISENQQATGAASFRLVAYGGAEAPAQQTLTLNRTFLAGPTSSISFDNLYWSLLDQAASVDVSLDGGTTWQPASSESPPSAEQDTSFTHKSISLSQFAGHQIQLRFALTYTTGNWPIGSVTAEPNGWYFDNVSVANVQAAGTSALSLTGTPSFVFANSQQGRATVEVRPQFNNPSYGSAFGSWSPALAVTSIGTTGFATLTASANPSLTGQSVTYTATVAPTDNGGTVAFADNGTAIAGCESVSLNVSGQATCTQTYSDSAPTSIVATYSGDGNFLGGSSTPLVQVVNGPAFTGGTMSASASEVRTGQPVTFTATVTPTDGGGTVDFSQGFTTAVPGCTGVPLTAAGQAICTWVPSAPGNLSIDAFYNGDPAFIATNLGATLLRVTQPTSTTLTTSDNPATDGEQLVVTAKVTPAIDRGSVQFTDNGVSLPGCGLTPLDVTGTATCLDTITGVGTHAIQAVYSGAAMAAPYSPSSSAILSQVVGTLTPSTTSVSSSANPSLTGQAVTFTATVTGGGTGTVSFTDNGNEVPGCQGLTVTAGQAPCTQTYPDTTPHLVAAYYTGDTSVAGSTSAGVNQVVNAAVAAAPTTTTITNLGNKAGQLAFAAPTVAAAPTTATATSTTAMSTMATTATATSTNVAAAAAPPSTVTGYNVYQGTAPGAESNTPINASRVLATRNGYTVKGLTAGKKYYFVVRAINAAGIGPASAEVSMTSASVPSAPTSVTASGGAEAVTVKWAAPTTTGGSPITGYNVFLGTATKNESAKPVNASALSASTRSYTLGGLTDGTRYYLVVRAVTARSSSPASAEVSALPRAVPQASTGILTYRASTSMGVQWVAPEQTGGTPITGYDVYRGTAAGKESATPVNASPLPASARTYALTGLTNGTTYYVKVRAINAVGHGAASAEGSATPTATATTPGWPASASAKAGNASTAVSWTAPGSTGGRSITGYNIYRGTTSGGESATPVNSTPLAATARSFTATGLTNAQPYYFRVRAINSVGTGAPSSEVFAIPQPASTVPGAPATLTAVAGAAKVTLKWTKPGWNGGSAVTGYNVYKGTVPGGESATPVNGSPLSPSSTTLTVSSLTSKTLYYFTVKAINSVGTGAPREVSARAG